MQKVKVLVVLVFFLGTAVYNLFAQYLDVGDDPAKIEIASTKNIIYNGKPVGGYAWSYDGEWFLGASKDGNYIMDKNGVFIQQIPRKFNYSIIFSDNKRIFYFFWENKKRFYAIYNLQTKQETVLSMDSKKDNFIDISLNGEILFMQVNVIARKASYSFFSYNPENGVRQELGVINQKFCSEYGDNRYLDKNHFLFRILDNGFKINIYDFELKKSDKLITHDTSEPTYSSLHDGRHVLVVVDWDTIYLYEANGVLLGKFRAFFDRGGQDKNFVNNDLIASYNRYDRELAPNGKLILLRMSKVGDETGNSTNEIYLFNFKGQSVRFLMPESLSEMKWNPQGDRLLNGSTIVFIRKAY